MARMQLALPALAVFLLLAAAASAASAQKDCGAIPGCIACAEVEAQPAGGGPAEATAAAPGATRRLLGRGGGSGSGKGKRGSFWRHLLGAADAEANADVTLPAVDAALDAEAVAGRRLQARGSPGRTTNQGRGGHGGSGSGNCRRLLEAAADAVATSIGGVAGADLPGRQLLGSHGGSGSGKGNGRDLLGKKGDNGGRRDGSSRSSSKSGRGLLEAAPAARLMVCTACANPGFKLNPLTGACGERLAECAAPCSLESLRALKCTSPRALACARLGRGNCVHGASRRSHVVPPFSYKPCPAADRL